ncbi:MAG TPA: formylglycine-generating enzyme family protein [Rhodothermales bacterium]
MSRTGSSASLRAAVSLLGAVLILAGPLGGCSSTAPVADGSAAASETTASQEPVSEVAAAPVALETDVDTIPGTTVTFEMIRLPGGTVTMPNGETVEVGPFWIERTETTWDEFDVYALGLDLKTDADRAADVVFRPSKPYGAPDRGFGHTGYAAISMSIGTAIEYGTWLSNKTGKSYRIPTMAEWQYACMAGAATDPGADVATLQEKAWFWDNAFDKTHPVASLEPNAFGLHDMLGNAMEWCIGDDMTPTACGGSYNDKAEAIGCLARAEQTPRWQMTDPQIPKSIFWLTDAPFVGFRVVRDQ